MLNHSIQNINLSKAKFSIYIYLYHLQRIYKIIGIWYTIVNTISHNNKKVKINQYNS